MRYWAEAFIKFLYFSFKPLRYIETVWGFDGADDGIIKSVGRKESKEQKEYDYEYFIAYYCDNNMEAR